MLSLSLMACSGFQLFTIPVGWLADMIGERPTIALLGSMNLVTISALALLLARAPAAAPDAPA